MKKRLLLLALIFINLLVLNSAVLPAHASEPTIIVAPDKSMPGGSFNFDITATSFSTVENIQVKDPEGNVWVLKAQTIHGWWVQVTILLRDNGDSIRLTWPDASFSVLNDPNHNINLSPNNNIKWINKDGKEPHTQSMGTYSLTLSGIGCHYFFVGSFLVVPESPFGTLSIVCACLVGLVIIHKKHL